MRDKIILGGTMIGIAGSLTAICGGVWWPAWIALGGTVVAYVALLLTID